MNVLVCNCLCRGYSICGNIISYVPAELDCMVGNYSFMMTIIEKQSSSVACIRLGPMDGRRVENGAGEKTLTVL